MKKNLVIDTSVYITYAIYNKTYRLIDAMDKYELMVFVNNQLLLELVRNLRFFLQNKDTNAGLIIQAIKEATINVATTAQFDLSPDPKDNFLFDLALQTNSEVIVTKEKALLNFEASPVPIHDIKWFKETYPVPL
jgi:putative PIN family toxin of toxin-antitoxin system